ncbi:FAD-dependent thymidylate synthase [Desulfurispirillum indicum]|uniref:Flavin-dependent thymidylate synthase n=1 Tax=Desulfurispirillum indicum (strain ATCC BAA-1389 / DSM 22839 / S5) TaxID=653733 RepID=E6W469_DESIS|nr:FAD-dependent thymidylate synthase [Desulfurispirillum indicum]ADU67033.1 thymidylate synthase, flavin-dependent [Desulfurispirillum indicum S5]UCZ56265.1 FAD-dependent thymidylate synthase [Desulfurispirillum indicum]
MKTQCNVVLLKHTEDPEGSVYAAARLCYSPAHIEELMEASATEKQKFVQKIRDLGHLSVFEHVSFTFAVEGISRACSHQLVRHRLASYSQQSQRYVRQGQFSYIEPDSMAAMPAGWFAEKMATMQRWYQEALDAGLPAEDARFLLPNACETRIILTMNARELMLFFSLRCCERAQWEIRAMADQMLEQCRTVSPVIFADAGPGCLRGPCPEGSMCCGKTAQVRERYREGL